MNTLQMTSWHEANQQYLITAFSLLRELLEYYILCQSNHEHEKSSDKPQTSDTEKVLKNLTESMTSPPALDTLCVLFNLSSFERNILLLCAGMEMDSRFASLCAKAQGDPRRIYPTFSLALSALPDPHWSALTPASPLRYWRLVELKGDDLLTTTPLRINEKALHYLAGIPYTDERLSAMIEPMYTARELVPSHLEITDRIVKVWSNIKAESLLSVILLCGDETPEKCTISKNVSSVLGMNLFAISASALPLYQPELFEMIRLCEREAAMSASVVYLDCEHLDMSDSTRMYAVTTFIEKYRRAMIIGSPQERIVSHRPMITFAVPKPTVDEQRLIWQNVSGSLNGLMDGQVEKLVSQFSLSAHAISSIKSEALEHLSGNGRDSCYCRENTADLLWNICLAQTRPRLENLAEHIKPVAAWNDLVLPDSQKQTLQEIAIHVRQRLKVYEIWGFARKSSRGLGINALFLGESGTGKTMAAEVLANELSLDLYRIDLSQVVSKYIGETEKNIKKVFDAAEDSGTILLFDEADALFGKRSEVKDSHDRYANIEISYLLQRMEAYRGLAILTTNMKNALDAAFLRRIRFVVHFPFPDLEHRAAIWSRIFPSNTPMNGVAINKLSRLSITGGNIRNIAMNAAFLAADADEPVSMQHILSAVRSEYTKLEKALSSAEIEGWE